MTKPLACLLCLLLSACATQLGVRDESDQRLSMFSQIVFAPDYDSRRTDILAKWVSPIHIELKGDDDGRYKPEVASQTKSLADLTGLEISFASESKPSNVTIHFAEQSQLQPLLAAAGRNGAAAGVSTTAYGCYPEISKDSGHRITGGRVIIRVDPGAHEIRLLTGILNRAEARNEQIRIKRCIVYGLLYILGFVHDSDIIRPSVFNSNDRLTNPTTLDLRMIKALYHASLKPGMARREALSIAEPLLKN